MTHRNEPRALSRHGHVPYHDAMRVDGSEEEAASPIDGAAAGIDRRSLLAAAAAGIGALACGRAGADGAQEARAARSPQEDDVVEATSASQRQPVVFVGHGSPMNAIEDNRWSQAFKALGGTLPRPRAILAVSAHWYVRQTLLTSAAAPRTIHDFGGFPRPLYEIEYRAPGDVDLAARVAALLGERAGLDASWGLDHGTWSVLVHTHPAADVPVVQLSLDARLAPADHVTLARSLAPLRDQGVLILASGNATHNLRHAMAAMRRGDEEVPEWSGRFDADVARAAAQHDTGFLARALASDDGRASHPTPDHYLPLLYAAGAASGDDAVTFPIEGFHAGLSMRAIRYG